MTQTRLNPDGSLTEIPPAVLVCGCCPWTPGQVTIGYVTRRG